MKIFEKDLVDLSTNAESAEELFRESFAVLKNTGYVQDDFLEALNKREHDYPTGLEFPNIAIAIPHADPQYVSKPFIYIQKLNNKISFKHMGNASKEIFPELVFTLGMKEGEKQLELLSELMEFFTNEKIVEELKSINNEEKLLYLLSNNIMMEE